MADILAYFLTWRTYGSWLHGDDRGSVDRWNNVPGTPLIPPDEARVERAAYAMAGDEYVLCEDGRAVVDRTIRRHCEIRHWKLLALNARTTHVHVVVRCSEGVSPERAMEQFKAWCTRRLREAELAGAEQDVWGEHGSTRWLDTDESLGAAVEYVLYGQ